MIREGQRVTRYLETSTDDLANELTQRNLLDRRGQLASQFTSQQNFEANGYVPEDKTRQLRNDFDRIVPYRSELTSLHLSREARSQGSYQY